MGDRRQKPEASVVITGASEIITCTENARDLIGRIENGCVAIAGDRIVAAGAREEVNRAVDTSGAAVIDATGKVVAPGFVDCHTHLVFGGSRVREYAARMTTDDPADLQWMGIETGIMVSVKMTRQASEEELFTSARARLLRMLAAGTTTLESKSGYGLTTVDEIKMLRVNARLGKETPVDIVSTFLGAHGWPPDVSREMYIDMLIGEMIPWVAGIGVATFCDVWCDDGHFTTADSERILEAAAGAGLRPKIHTDAYSYIGGSDLAADMRMASADHLNYTPPEALGKLAGSGVPGVLLPGIDFAVRHPRPVNARAVVDAGVTVALATNLCPGGWTESMQLVMALACRNHRLSPAEALRAATLGGAKALGLESDRGSLEPGKLADIQVWDVPSYEHVIYRLGGNVVDKVIKRGKVVVEGGRVIVNGDGGTH
ncbi:MAG: imidazolonepropionase [Firmicutes bacterium]|nr:imidazolonepropionase [Bacillota bacterium]